jgi:chaperonin GroES
MAVNVKPLGDRVLVKPLDEKEVKKGRHHHSRYRQGKAPGRQVIALGTGKLDDNGKKIEFTVKVGDKVLIQQIRRHRNQGRRQEYLIMREDDILGVLG